MLAECACQHKYEGHFINFVWLADENTGRSKLAAVPSTGCRKSKWNKPTSETHTKDCHLTSEKIVFISSFVRSNYLNVAHSKISNLIVVEKDNAKYKRILSGYNIRTAIIAHVMFKHHVIAVINDSLVDELLLLEEFPYNVVHFLCNLFITLSKRCTYSICVRHLLM